MRRDPKDLIDTIGIWLVLLTLVSIIPLVAVFDFLDGCS